MDNHLITNSEFLRPAHGKLVGVVYMSDIFYHLFSE
jgi:hypothetical protein